MKTYLQQIGMTLALMMVTVVGWGQTFYPSLGAINIEQNPVITITFDAESNITLGDNKYFYIEPYDYNDQTSTKIKLQTQYISGRTTYPRDSRILINGNTLTLDLSNDLLSPEVEYLIYTDISTIIINGTPWSQLDNNFEYWRFTTQAQPIPPTILTDGYNPIKGATNVSVTPSIELTFDMPIELSDNTNAYIKVKKVSDNSGSSYDIIASEISVINNTLTLTIPPSDELSGSTEYYIWIDNNMIQSESGTYFAGITSTTEYRFTTLPAPAKWISGFPNVSAQTAASLQLNGKADSDGNYYYIISNSYTTPNAIDIKNATGALLAGNGTVTANTEFNTTVSLSSLASSVTYYIYTVIENAGGFGEVKQTIFYHDANAPYVISTSPTDGSTGVSIDGDIIFTFNEVIYLPNGTIVDDSNVVSLITMKQGSTSIPFTATTTGQMITVNPSASLAEGTTYSVSCNIVEDKYGNEQSEGLTIMFTTDKTNVWTGSINNDWENSGNWQGNATPSTGSVIIPSGLNNYPIINNQETYVISNLEMGATSQLTIEFGGALTVNKKLNLLSSPSKNASLFIEGALNYTPSMVSIRQGITDYNKDYFISPPVSGATQSNTGINGGIWGYTNNPKGWYPLSTTTAMTAANGYMAYSSAGSEIVYKGTINNEENYPISGVRTTGTGENFGWILAGNPYPCAINWDLIPLANKNNITNAYWLWLNDSQKYGTYQGLLQEGVNLSIPGEIPSGHAFWAQVAIDATNGTLTIPNTARKHNSTSYLKSSSSNIDKSIIRLIGFNKNDTQTDEIIIALVDGAENGKDRYDADKQFTTNTNSDLVELYSTIDNQKASINSLDKTSFKGEMIIPIGYKAIKASDNESFGIALSSVKGFPDDIKISIEDTETNTIIEMTPDSHICFESPNSNTDNPSRFNLHLKSASIALNNQSLKRTSGTVMISARDNKINITLRDLKNPTYQLINMNGQVISSGALNTDTTNEIETEQKGFIIVKIISDNETFTQKVLLDK